MVLWDILLENENEVLYCKRGFVELIEVEIKGPPEYNLWHYCTVMSEPKQLQLQVEGLSNLMEALKEHEGKRRTVMFMGSMNESGESWCPDCRQGM